MDYGNFFDILRRIKLLLILEKFNLSIVKLLSIGVLPATS